jgi:hypothetical protein
MYTRHAEVRCQQRGIQPGVVDTIIAFGRQVRRHHAEVCFLDKPARRRLERELGRDAYRQIADRLNTYVVVADDGSVITAAKRLGRIRH